MEKQLYDEEFLQDSVNISRVLPHVPFCDIKQFLLNIKEDPQRVEKTVKNFIDFYISNEDTAVFNDMILLRNIFFNYPMDIILNDLQEVTVKYKRDRVQLVMQKYLKNNAAFNKIYAEEVLKVKNNFNDEISHNTPNVLNNSEEQTNNLPSTTDFNVDFNNFFDKIMSEYKELNNSDQKSLKKDSTKESLNILSNTTFDVNKEMLNQTNKELLQSNNGLIPIKHVKQKNVVEQFNPQPSTSNFILPFSSPSLIGFEDNMNNSNEEIMFPNKTQNLENNKLNEQTEVSSNIFQLNLFQNFPEHITKIHNTIENYFPPYIDLKLISKLLKNIQGKISLHETAQLDQVLTELLEYLIEQDKLKLVKINILVEYQKCLETTGKINLEYEREFFTILNEVLYNYVTDYDLLLKTEELQEYSYLEDKTDSASVISVYSDGLDIPTFHELEQNSLNSRIKRKPEERCDFFNVGRGCVGIDRIPLFNPLPSTSTAVNFAEVDAILNHNFEETVVTSHPLKMESIQENVLTEIEPPETIEITSESEDEDEISIVPNTNNNCNSKNNNNNNHPFYFKLLEMFPNICRKYLRELCSGKDNNDAAFSEIISKLLNGEYKEKTPERAESPETLDFDEQYKILLELFPNADPTYLQSNCERLIDNPMEFKFFVNTLLETHNYPSKESYLKKMKLSAQQKQYTTEFNIEKFLEVIPDPENYFKQRQSNYEMDTEYVLNFLKNQFRQITVKDITSAFKESGYNVLISYKKLSRPTHRLMRTKRKLYPDMNCSNIPLLQEIAYILHKDEIIQYQKHQDKLKYQARLAAKEKGLFVTCECCYDDEVMPEEVVDCGNGHKFCKECVIKGCEVKFGEGQTKFLCLMSCEKEFSLQILQNVLPPKLFSKVAQKKQMEEVKSAGINDLEFCPFCDFATIPAPGDKLFRCLNNDCMKESCRECKEINHIPLRCDEVEKDNDVRVRTYIENKMTEALIRKCYKCGLKFIKEEGCNKMTCSCGAMMCYICNKPVQDYKHFNGQGGDQFQLCPLYSDINVLHRDAVKRGAEEAKREMGVGSKTMKIDPTADLDKYYNNSTANRSEVLLNVHDDHGHHQHFLHDQFAIQIINIRDVRNQLQNRHQRQPQ